MSSAIIRHFSLCVVLIKALRRYSGIERRFSSRMSSIIAGSLSLAFIFLAVNVFVAFMKNSRNEKTAPGTIVVVQPNVALVLVILDVISTVIIVLGMISDVRDGQTSAAPYILFIVFVNVLCLCVSYPISRWKVVISNKGVMYRDWLGRRHEYTFEELDECRLNDNGDYRYFHNGRKAFTIDSGLHAANAIDFISQHGVPLKIEPSKWDGVVHTHTSIIVLMSIGAAVFGTLGILAAFDHLPFHALGALLFTAVILIMMISFIKARNWIEDDCVFESRLFKKTRRVPFKDISKAVFADPPSGYHYLDLYDHEGKRVMRINRGEKGYESFQRKFVGHMPIMTH